MSLRRIQNLSPWQQGTINGLLFVLSVELITRSLYLQYLYEENQLQSSLESGVHICRSFFTSFNFNWYFGLFLNFISAILAGHLVNRGLPNLINRATLFWQTVGVFTIAILTILSNTKSSVSNLIACGKLNCSEFVHSNIPELYYQELRTTAFWLFVTLCFNLVFSLFLRKQKTNFS